jgi:hypothetical protein
VVFTRGLCGAAVALLDESSIVAVLNVSFARLVPSNLNTSRG